MPGGLLGEFATRSDQPTMAECLSTLVVQFSRMLSITLALQPLLTSTVPHKQYANLINEGLCNQTKNFRQGQMFYVGTNGYIQEKRKALDDNETFWQPGGFNKIGIKLAGNITLPKKVQNLDPINQFDGYNMAAVYSDIFANGAGTRFFYHQSSSNGTNWVQEWIWTRETDNWKIGQAIPNVYPNSHIAATVDEQNRLLRLYFSVGNLTLQESYLNISDPQGLYNNGTSSQC